jgi:hypothetical protein
MTQQTARIKRPMEAMSIDRSQLHGLGWFWLRRGFSPKKWASWFISVGLLAFFLGLPLLSSLVGLPFASRFVIPSA